jgi:hypothetical protein
MGTVNRQRDRLGVGALFRTCEDPLWGFILAPLHAGWGRCCPVERANARDRVEKNRSPIWEQSNKAGA